MMSQKHFWSALLFVLLFFSCDLLRDSPYEVKAWTPGEGYHKDPSEITISLLLSHESDRIQTEQAFSLTENGRTMKGFFSWDGSWLCFTPASPLETNRDYVITLGIGAQDTKGISLESKFEASFTTFPPGGRPRILSIEPEHDGVLYERRGELRIAFSEPISLDSCIDFVNITPSTPGSWLLEDDNRTAVFTPREPWQAGSPYRLKVESNFPCISNHILGTDHISIFHIGDDWEKPVLLKALAVLPNGDEEEIPLEIPGLSPRNDYTSWERSTGLCLIFSEPVDLSLLKNLLTCEPSHTLVMDSPPEMASRAVFHFAEYPAWGSSFLFRLNRGVKDKAGNESDEDYFFRITAKGPLSKPPALAGMRLPMKPGNRVDHDGLSFTAEDLFKDLPIENDEDHYPFMVETPSWIELYFDTAVDTDIDPFSVMDLFRVEATNQSFIFSPRRVKSDNFTWIEPREGWDTFTRLEIQGVMKNTINSGVVTFRIPPGLRDMRGNTSTMDFRISLQK